MIPNGREIFQTFLHSNYLPHHLSCMDQCNVGCAAKFGDEEGCDVPRIRGLYASAGEETTDVANDQKTFC